MRKLLTVICAMALLAFGGVAIGATKGKKTTGVAYVGVTHAEGNTIFVSGEFKDKLLGRGALVYVTTASGTQTPGEYKVTAKKITLYTTRGAMVGKGSATQVFNQDGSSEVKDGTFSLTKGTGAFKGHTFTGTFSGPYKSGVYTFNYKAVLR